LHGLRSLRRLAHFGPHDDIHIANPKGHGSAFWGLTLPITGACETLLDSLESNDGIANLETITSLKPGWTANLAVVQQGPVPGAHVFCHVVVLAQSQLEMSPRDRDIRKHNVTVKASAYRRRTFEKLNPTAAIIAAHHLDIAERFTRFSGPSNQLQRWC
jgi:hypothetical protein